MSEGIFVCFTTLAEGEASRIEALISQVLNVECVEVIVVGCDIDFGGHAMRISVVVRVFPRNLENIRGSVRAEAVSIEAQEGGSCCLRGHYCCILVRLRVTHVVHNGLPRGSLVSKHRMACRGDLILESNLGIGDVDWQHGGVDWKWDGVGGG